MVAVLLRLLLCLYIDRTGDCEKLYGELVAESNKKLMNAWCFWFVG